jgi:hypothetical protein
MTSLMAGDCMTAAAILNISLPVELVDIEMNCEGNNIQLIWKTASE